MKLRLKTLILTLALLSLPNIGQSACLGFSDEEMPPTVAEYVCAFPSIQGQAMGRLVAQGRTFLLVLLESEGVDVGLVIQELEPNEQLGKIMYFQKPDGTVLLDRRLEMPAFEEKGQPG